MIIKKGKPAQLSDFKDNISYKYIGKHTLITPYGIITKTIKRSYTGKEWKDILVYDFSPNTTPPFSKMFKELKKSKNGN